MLDLTKNIKLEGKTLKKYKIARVTLYALFVLGTLFVAQKVLFPSQSLSLFFDNLNASKNTIYFPRLNNGELPSKGIITKDDSLTFNANPLGNFSSVNVNIQSADKKILTGSIIEIQKSYQAFLYPEGKPLGFKNGSLLTTEDGNYYLVSNGTLRKFANTETILSLGYPKSSFALINPNELAYNPIGEEIVSTSNYPDDTLFIIDENFYQLKKGKLLSFISNRAFLSQYQSIQAIPKDKDFFNTYESSENSLGFADGTLASAEGSAFILSSGKSYPIADSVTFEAMGFSWDNVIALESDEMGAYERQKQFTLNQPHPDGTIFTDKTKNKYYMIENGLKRQILSQNILKTYPYQNAIEANLENSTKKLNCSLKKNLWPLNDYSCQIDLTQISHFLGNDYQLNLKPNNDAKIKEIDLNFSTPFTWQSMRDSLSNIKGNLQNNYSAQ